MHIWIGVIHVSEPCWLVFVSGVVQALSNNGENQDAGAESGDQNSQLLVELWLIFLIVILTLLVGNTIVLWYFQIELLRDVDKMLGAQQKEENLGVIGDKEPRAEDHD